MSASSKLKALAIACAAAVCQCVASAQPTVSAVVNGASYSAAVAPGCWVAIFGANLAVSPQNASGTLATSLGGVSVSVAGLAAPLLYVSSNQINALIPAETAVPAITVVPLVVTAPAGQSKSYSVRLSREAPGIFTRNGAGTGRAFVFDANFKDLDNISANDIAILYATGLGPTDASGKVTDPVDVYMGERQARVLSATLAPGFPGIYQLNVVVPPAPATDRLYLRTGGWQSNITDVGIRSGDNAANASGDIEGLYPSTDPFFTLPPCLDESSSTPCGPGQMLSIMLHAASFRVSFDIASKAVPFDVAAVGPAGASLISINPATGTYTASISTLTPEAARGDFSKSIVPLWDFSSCDAQAVCFAFPGPSVLPASRLDPFWLQATRALPAPNSSTNTSPNALFQLSGTISGGHLTIDGNTNAVLSRFGGIVQVPLGPFDQAISTFKLYVDGRLVASKDVPYRVAARPSDTSR